MAMMADLSTALLGQACRIFMDLSYPAGSTTIPLKKRAYYDIDPERPLSDYLPPSPAAVGIVQELSTRCGYEFRLGCCHFMHLKLRALRMEHRGKLVWVFAVDTHDAFSRTSVAPPPDHPDAPAWLEMQEANRQLKDRIEDEFEQAGLHTFKGLLRSDLESPVGR
jgi:hypothetical protein